MTYSSRRVEGILTPEQQKKGRNYFYAFSIFSVIIFQCVCGTVLVLFARELKASATQIGILTSFLPFTIALQVFAAPFIDRTSYKRVLITGWLMRAVIAGLLLIIPMINDRYGSRVAVLSLMGIMLSFYIFRALAVGAWLPWMKELASEKTIGRFLSQQQLFVQATVIIANTAIALYMKGQSEISKFLRIFTIGILFGIISVFLLARVPETAVHKKYVPLTFRQSVVRPFSKRRFRSYLWFTTTWSFSIGAFLTFTVLYMKEYIGISTSYIFVFSALPSLGAILTVFKWGEFADKYGSKPVIGLCSLGITLVVFLLFFTGKVNPFNVGMLTTTGLLFGIFQSGSALASSRYLLNLTPQRNKATFMMVFTVCNGLAAGIAPIIAGSVLDIFKHLSLTIGNYEINNYRIFYAYTALLSFAPLYLWRFIAERGKKNLGELRGLATPLRPFRSFLNLYLYWRYEMKKRSPARRQNNRMNNPG